VKLEIQTEYNVSPEPSHCFDVSIYDNYRKFSRSSEDNCDTGFAPDTSHLNSVVLLLSRLFRSILLRVKL